MTTRNTLLVAAGALTLTLTWYLFRPERLLLDTVVAESLEEAVAPGAFDTASTVPVALLQGNFRGVQHDAAGSATIYRLSDGTRVLRFTEFATSNGPDLYVYMVAAGDAPDNESVERAGYVSLGRLKGNEGDQNYVLPEDLDFSRYRSVSVWCKRFAVNFAVAPLQVLAEDEPQR